MQPFILIALHVSKVNYLSEFPGPTLTKILPGCLPPTREPGEIPYDARTRRRDGRRRPLHLTILEAGKIPQHGIYVPGIKTMPPPHRPANRGIYCNANGEDFYLPWGKVGTEILALYRTYLISMRWNNLPF